MSETRSAAAAPTANSLSLAFRPFAGEADYALLLSIFTESTRADGMSESVTLEDIQAWCAPSARFDPTSDLVLAVGAGPDGHSATVGFSRLGWYTGPGGTRLYDQECYMTPEWRGHGFWAQLLRRGERRLAGIAAGHPPAAQRFYQGWATASQTQWIATLEAEGYQAVRHFHNMLYRLDAIPERPLPAGLEVRPVLPEHYRAIWEAQREVQPELFESVMEHWTEERFARWAADDSHTPELWQIAWDGNQVAGMVLARIDATANATYGRKRGYTEHIFVRKPWRGRGLATALIARSLAQLKAEGMEEAELGVDVENASGAHALYERIGFSTFSTDIWFRKPM